MGKSGARRMAAIILALLAMVLMACASAFTGVVWPEEGTTIKQDGDLRVDCSNASDGYILVRGPETKSNLKLRIYQGESYVTYDLDGSGQTQVFPLTLGSGNYRVNLYKEKSKKTYTNAGQVSFSVKLTSDNAPYLCPNRYVWYTEDCEAVKKSMELCAGLKTDKEKLDAIVGYMKSSFLYDYVRAVTQKSNYVGDVDALFSTRMGLCQDLSAALACMLRVQGIPTKMITGEMSSSTGKMYHAWNSVLIGDDYVLVDVTTMLTQARQVEYEPKNSY